MKLRVIAHPARKNKHNNPYNALLYNSMPQDVVVTEFEAETDASLTGDILHIHWPDLHLRSKNPIKLFLRSRQLIQNIMKFKNQGGKVIWTAHNDRPHKFHYRTLVLYLWQKIISKFDGIIFMSRVSRDEILQHYPSLSDTPYAIIPHGHYRNHYPESTQRPSVKASSNSTQLLLFGKMRPHRGVEQLIDVHIDAQIQDIDLTIAGSIKKGYKNLLKSTDKLSTPGVRWRLEHIPDSDIAQLILSAQALILPYVKILNSGTAILALSYNRPVIAPATGSFIELNEQFGDNWIHLYQPPLSAEKYIKAVNWVKNREQQALDLTALEWDLLAEKTKIFYQQVLSS